MRWLPLLALCACGEDYLRVDFEAERYDQKEHAIGVGLIAHVEVIHVTMSAGDEEPDEAVVGESEMTIRFEGATRVACDSSNPAGNSICIVADDVDQIVAHFETPHGDITAKRRVAHALRLSRYSPRWAVSDDRTQILAGKETDCSLHVREQGGDIVSGHVTMFDPTGDIVFDGKHVTGNAGMASIAVTGRPDITPLQIKIVPDEATALASIAKFRVDRMFYDDRPDGLDSLTAYTEGPVGGYVFEAFDADDFWVLPDLPYTVNVGPNLVTHPWPVAEGPCTTNDYCFLRGTIDSGTAMSFVELAAGAATQRFPVKVVHGAY